MEIDITQVLNTSAYYQLCGLLAAAIFFAVAGYKEVKEENLAGLFYLALAVFFGGTHIMYLYAAGTQALFSSMLGDLTVWKWLTMLLAPSLATLFVLQGVISFGKSQSRLGLIKLFFGLTLVCYVFMIGQSWPIDVRGIITLVWAVFWFNTEFIVFEERA